jgi:hypothetical protein
MNGYLRSFCKAAIAAACLIAAFGCQGASHRADARGTGPKTLHYSHRPADVPAHVQTAAYLQTPQTIAADPRRLAPYLTWAYPLYGKFTGVRAAGIKTIFYINPVMPQSTQYEYTALQKFPGLTATDCSGRPISTYKGGGVLTDPRSPNAPAYYADVINWYVRNKLLRSGGSAVWDAIFIDNNGALYGASSLPCNYDPGSWGAAFDKAIAHVNQRFVVNSLATRENQVQTYVKRLAAPNIIGGMFEECFNDRLWTAEEASQIATVALFHRLHKPPGPGWWCYLDNTSAPGDTVIPQRLFAYASFLLTYDPYYSTFQESFTTPSTFEVFPETGFVPLQPRVAPSQIDDLRTEDGAYVRVYEACYYRKRFLGACEIAVNPGNGTVNLSHPRGLRHSMQLHGSGVLDGGYVSFEAPAP